MEIYNKIIRPNLREGSTYNVGCEEIKELFDYFEHIQISIIAIYSAIEAMSNAAIPNAYTLTKTNNKGITEVWTKGNIERWTPTTEKIGKIVPEILSIEGPHKHSFWNDFLALKEVRDEIIHQKQSKADPQEIEESFLNRLLNDTIFSKILSGFSLIKYFCEKDKTHTYFPILEDETPLNVNIVDSFNP